MKLPQVILVLLAVAVGVILYLTPIAPIAHETEETEAASTEVAYDILDDITEIKNGLDSASLAEVNKWEVSDSESANDSIIAFYDMLRKPVGAAFHSLKRAEASNTAEAWTEAGERFLLNAKYMGDQPRKASWFTQARSCFEKAVELDPEDLDIQVDLGVCLMESATFLGTPPMEGIGILKGVEQKDPKNIKALINLGYFAIRSGQFDKAEERFNQVLAIDGAYAEAYLYLADLHERQKMYKEAVADLEKFKTLIDDPKKSQEVDDYILELNKNI
ncbi:MAG: tetratricopeptide repeat protein [Flavobacteriales bacterium]|nr:tetratricopeptide repeat protein [Flavobacteriales bacterium]